MSYIDMIDGERIPEHIAIIMDGNGRWAQQRGLARTDGHQAGAVVVKKIAEDAARLGVRYLTLYTFSTENWNRPSMRWQPSWYCCSILWKRRYSSRTTYASL